MFLKLGSAEPHGSAKGCQGFRQTIMRNGGKVLLALLNLCVRIKIRVPTFDTNHPVTDSTQTINRCFNPEASQFRSPIGQSAHLTIDRRCIRRNYQVIDQFEVSGSYMTCNAQKKLNSRI